MIVKVPIIGDGVTTETAFRPDVPAGIKWSALRIHADEGVAIIHVPDERVKVPRGERLTGLTDAEAREAAKQATSVDDLETLIAGRRAARR